MSAAAAAVRAAGGQRAAAARVALREVRRSVGGHVAGAAKAEVRSAQMRDNSNSVAQPCIGPSVTDNMVRIVLAALLHFLMSHMCKILI